MQFQPYLFFDGTCEEAMRFYERTLSGEIKMLMKMGDSPGGCDQMPPGNDHRIMHASLVIGDSMLMASDSMIGQPYEPMKGIWVTLSYPTVAEARRIYDALSDGGHVTMPMDKTFWAEAFGMVTDRFGTPWMINGGPQGK